MSKTLRKSFLVTTAAAALVTGLTIASAQPGGLGTQGHTQRSETGQTGRAMGEERKALGEQKGTKQLGEQKGTKQLGEQKGTKGTSGQTTTQRRAGQTGFAQGGAQGRVSINEQQRTRIHDVVVNKNFTSRFRASNVNFDVRVGTRIPRSFHLFAVPEDIVVIAPRFRGFRFFIVEDEIVFVDPVTFEIVAVMPL